MSKKVALIGWNPKVVDYRKWPDLTAEKLSAALEAEKNKLNGLGYETSWLFIDAAETAFNDVKVALTQNNFDCVLIGAGVRKVDEHFIVFEQLINAIHEFAPNAKICFNTNPNDTAEAVQRWA